MKLPEAEQIAKRHGGRSAPFQAASYGLKKFEGLENGCCLALTVLAMSQSKGAQLAKLTSEYVKFAEAGARAGAPLVTHSQSLMNQQRSLVAASKVGYGRGGHSQPDEKFERWWRWMQYRGREYGLRLLEPHQCKTTISNLAFSIVDWISRETGIYVVGMTNNFVGHAIGFFVNPDDIVFFDPNHGFAKVPKPQFAAYLKEFCDEAEFDYDRWSGVKYAAGKSMDMTALAAELEKKVVKKWPTVKSAAGGFRSHG